MICVYPGCGNTSRTRGLCHGHYQTMRSYVRRGVANEGDLLERRLLMPKGTGGTPVRPGIGHSAFFSFSKQRGDA